MLEECLAGTGIAQVIGWGFGQLLERGKLVDLLCFERCCALSSAAMA
jgi:hypothetical protein